MSGYALGALEVSSDADEVAIGKPPSLSRPSGTNEAPAGGAPAIPPESSAESWWGRFRQPQGATHSTVPTSVQQSSPTQALPESDDEFVVPEGITAKKRIVDHCYEGPPVTRTSSDGTRKVWGQSRFAYEPEQRVSDGRSFVPEFKKTLSVPAGHKTAAVHNTMETKERYRKAFSSWTVTRVATVGISVEDGNSDEVDSDAEMDSDDGFRQAFAYNSEPVNIFASQFRDLEKNEVEHLIEATPSENVPKAFKPLSELESWELGRMRFDGEQNKGATNVILEAKFIPPTNTAAEIPAMDENSKGDTSLAQIAATVLDAVDLVESRQLQRLQRFARKGNTAMSCPVQRYQHLSTRIGSKKEPSNETSAETNLPTSRSLPVERMTRFRQQSKEAPAPAQLEEVQLLNLPASGAAGAMVAAHSRLESIREQYTMELPTMETIPDMDQASQSEDKSRQDCSVHESSDRDSSASDGQSIALSEVENAMVCSSVELGRKPSTSWPLAERRLAQKKRKATVPLPSNALKGIAEKDEAAPEADSSVEKQEDSQPTGEREDVLGPDEVGSKSTPIAWLARRHARGS